VGLGAKADGEKGRSAEAQGRETCVLRRPTARASRDTASNLGRSKGIYKTNTYRGGRSKSGLEVTGANAAREMQLKRMKEAPRI